MELYFDDPERAKSFYAGTLGLKVSDERKGHYAKFDGGTVFVCLEKKGAESYPSRDKAVLFFEVENLQTAIGTIGKERIVGSGPGWAVLHDPEGHNILVLQKK